MKHFQNILFVIQGHEIADGAFQQAVNIVKRTDADITYLALHPEFSGDLAEFKDTYQKNIKDSLVSKLEEAGLSGEPNIVYESKTPHFVTIVQHVLQYDNDLVVKATEQGDEKQKKGLKSLDMSLLRKCPCPVWLCREADHNSDPTILTAIDPESENPEGHSLSIKLLQLGEFVATSLNGTHKVIACWEFEHESYLRDSGFGRIEGSKVDQMILDTQKKHREGIEALIQKSGIKTPEIIHQRGKAFDVIPEYTDRFSVDLVVMGTVARTGIPGFLIGNTAENILQNLSCSLLAVKPSGFVSPIKAY
mgnify:CR=1 FL=1